MSKKSKVLLASLGIVVLLGVIGAGAALAQDPPKNPTDYQNDLLGKVATILGIDQQRVTSAVTQAARELRNEQINRAVAEGRITQEYANWLKQMPASGAIGSGFGRGMHGFGGGRFVGVPRTAPTPAPTPSQ